MERFFTIFDIHGRNDLLQDILEQLHLHYNLNLCVDKLIFLGDYIDRGPDSKGVIETIKKLKEDNPGNVIALRGNHEDMAIDACTLGKLGHERLWAANGGDETSRSYGSVPKLYMDPEHIKWLASLPLFHVEPGFFFSHAPVHKNFNMPYEDLSNWTYLDFVDEENNSKNFGDRVGVCGHIHRLWEKPGEYEPRMYPHYIFGDTGAGCSTKAPLTCIEVKSREYIQAWPKDIK